MTPTTEIKELARSRAISLYPQEWQNIELLSKQWRTTTSGAVRRIILEWEESQVINNPKEVK